jgi:prepilin-type N-terminal cleavage/methylation domain-containing protein
LQSTFGIAKQGRIAAHNKTGECEMKKSSGFTLVEIMIVVAIIGLLAAIAIPSFVKARNTSQQNACINDLRQIDSAKEQCAMANNWANTEDCDVAATKLLVLDYIKNAPSCPASGTYTFGLLSAAPTCSIAGHAL